ncbi:MAG: peptidylprolyl isomerase [Acidobacteria bacterium]|nr:peptidylprolyl isomerase [Acidobacteriota bacterium]
MKKCPKCRTEYSDSIEICPNDDTQLEFVDTQTDDFTASTEDNYSTGAAGTKASPALAPPAASQSRGMSGLAKGLIVALVVLGLGAGLVYWKTKIGRHSENLNRVTAEEMQILLKDANPMQLKALAESPEQKKKIAENIKQLLAVASQARKEGFTDDPNVRQELENIRSVITATLYDKKINEGKGEMPPFGFISEDRVKEFWGEKEVEQNFISRLFGKGDKRSHEIEFQKFLDSKIAIAKESGRFPKDKELTEEEIKQAKDDFAKIKIYEEEAKEKSKELGGEFNRELELQIKLQQAQFIAGNYAQKVLAEKVKVNDEDVKKHIAEHPELDPKEKKAQAEQILSRAKAGEDFAKLAGEFSQDPGSKNEGGLYKDVPKGRMMPEFEQAALGLEPGKIAEDLVETSYGYHIIKLEKKGEGKDQAGQPAETYDVRHILITTTVKDPNNPMAREMPVSEMVKAQLEEEKQKQVLDEIVANNPVEVAEDFTVPEVSEEQMQKMMQQQMMQQQQMQTPPQGMETETGDAPKGTTPPKPAPKKK